MLISIGNNRFKSVAIPLAFDERYFLLEEQNGNDIWTVLTFVDGKAVLEILRNQPQQNALSTASRNPTGIITVADPKTGAFLYKLRPGSKNSSIFGTINGNETEIRITDREIRIAGNVYRNNSIESSSVGIRVGRDGSTIMGCGLPPEFGKLTRTSGSA